jgi:hypothetical protein
MVSFECELTLRRLKCTSVPYEIHCAPHENRAWGGVVIKALRY